MTFEWYEVKKVDEVRAQWSARGADAQRREVRERAALLMRMGRSKAEAVSRCKQNIDWQYELRGAASISKEVKRLVDEVYGRTLTLDPSVAGDV